MKSEVPSEIGIIAIFPPTATISPPQLALVLAPAVGAVSSGASACVFCTNCAKIG